MAMAAATAVMVMALALALGASNPTTNAPGVAGVTGATTNRPGVASVAGVTLNTNAPGQASTVITQTQYSLSGILGTNGASLVSLGYGFEFDGPGGTAMSGFPPVLGPGAFGPFGFNTQSTNQPFVANLMGTVFFRSGTNNSFRFVDSSGNTMLTITNGNNALPGPLSASVFNGPVGETNGVLMQGQGYGFEFEGPGGTVLSGFPPVLGSGAFGAFGINTQSTNQPSVANVLGTVFFLSGSNNAFRFVDSSANNLMTIANTGSGANITGAFAGDASALTNLPGAVFGTFQASPAVPVNQRTFTENASALVAMTSGTVRREHIIAVPCIDPIASFHNYYRSTSSTVQATTNPITFKASWDVDGVIYPMYFKGQRTNVLDPGGVVFSDPVGIMLAPSNAVYIRIWLSVTGAVPGGALYNGTGDGGGTDGYSATTDYCDSGTVAGANNARYWSASGIYATPVGVTPGVAIIGDSITAGTGDSWLNNGGASTNWAIPTGWAERGLKNIGLGWVNLSASGENTTLWNVSALRQREARQALHWLTCYGANDLNLVGATFASTISNWTKLWAYPLGSGKRVIQATILPHTTSSDYWISTTGQTVTAYESLRTNLNGWLLDRSATGAVAQLGSRFSVVDVAALVSTNGVWAPVTNAPIFSGTFNTNLTSTSAGDTNLIGRIAKHYYDARTVIKITGGPASPGIYPVQFNSGQFGETWYPVGSWTNGTPTTSTTYEVWLQSTTDGVHPNYDLHARASGCLTTNVFK